MRVMSDFFSSVLMYKVTQNYAIWLKISLIFYYLHVNFIQQFSCCISGGRTVYTPISLIFLK